ncbi:hypothetical protein Tco_0759116 [Tanacetum coccineum]
MMKSHYLFKNWPIIIIAQSPKNFIGSSIFGCLSSAVSIIGVAVYNFNARVYIMVVFLQQIMDQHHHLDEMSVLGSSSITPVMEDLTLHHLLKPQSLLYPCFLVRFKGRFSGSSVLVDGDDVILDGEDEGVGEDSGVGEEASVIVSGLPTDSSACYLPIRSVEDSAVLQKLFDD